MSIVTEISCDHGSDSTVTRLDPRPVLTRYGRFWAVYAAGVLVCVCVYKRGAAEVIRRLTQGAHGRAAQ